MRSLKFAALFAAVCASVATIAPSAHAVTVKPTTVNFGTVALNVSKPKTVAITIDPGYRLNALITTGLPFSNHNVNCTPTSTTCKAIVYFTPAVVGVVDSTFTVRECTPTFTCHDAVIPLHGVGGLLRAKPASVDFGSVATNGEKSKTLSIRIDPGFHVNALIGNGAPFSSHNVNCTSTVTKCKAIVYFDPTSAGVFDSTFTVRECDPLFNCDDFTVKLHGTGV